MSPRLRSTVGFPKRVSITSLSFALLSLLLFAPILHAQPVISVNPENLNFGESSLDQSVRLSLRVENRGNDDLIIESMFTSGDPFSIDVQADSGGVDSVWVIRPGRQYLYVEVFFTPRRSGIFNDSLTIISNDPNRGELLVPMYGEVPRVGVIPSSIDFGGVRPGQNVERALTIVNNGDAELTIQEMFTSGDPFSVDGNEFVLQPTSSRQVPLTFTPPDIVGFDGTLTILTDDEERDEVVVPLHGVGLTDPDIVVIPENLDFGDASIGQSVKQSLRIENRGGSDLTIESMFTSGDPFSIDAEPDSFGVDFVWVIRPGCGSVYMWTCSSRHARVAALMVH